ncbi:PHP domain-containing protein [Faecalimonas umbilicata]|nr:PHP domain-containing protein [Faecalimonas umbilicata]
MFIDLHMHEMRYSKDSFLKLEEMVVIAKEKGLDAICITDHDSMGLKKFAQEYSKLVDFPIFVGIEFYSLQGDIIAFGIEEYPDHRVSAQEFIDYVKERGGVCYSAHPFRNNRRGLEGHLNEVTGLDGIEVLNGSTKTDACRTAAEYAKKLGLIPVGASDCHVPEKVGICATYFPQDIRTPDDLVKAFKEGGMLPAYYLDGAYHTLDMDAFLAGEMTVDPASM